MTLSNAERQRRHRERLKAAVRGDGIGERVRSALDGGFRAVWDIWTRENYGGIEDFPTWQDMRRLFSTGDLRDLHLLFDLDAMATAAETDALSAARSVIEAVDFREEEGGNLRRW